MPGTLHVLGPQRPTPNVPDVLANLPVDGRVVLISAGWRHEETDAPAALARLGVQVTHLPLYDWFEQIRAASPEIGALWKQRQAGVLSFKAAYRERVGAALEALRRLRQRRDADARVNDEEIADALEDVRRLDARVVRRTGELFDRVPEARHPWEHPAVQRHRAAIEAALDGAGAVLVAGGHVGVLVSRLRFFGVEPLLHQAVARGTHVVAWSAGAMALSERIVLFYDDPPEGEAWPELFDRGAGLLPDAVFLPHARRRLRLDDAERVGLLASRFGPAPCIGLELGAHLAWDGAQWRTRGAPGTARWLCQDGSCAVWPHA